MFKTLIASTFLAASIAVPVMAADSGTSGTNMNSNGAAGTTNGGAAGTNKSGTTPMTTPGSTTGATGTTTGAAGTNTAAGAAGTVMYGQNVAASNIIGASVMDASNTSIGKIDDLVLNGQGQVTDYVVDVGGFLGIGSKRVALTPQDVTITADGNGNLQAKTQLTKDALNARPDYTKPEVPAPKNGSAGTTSGTAPAGTSGATGTTGAAGGTTELCVFSTSPMRSAHTAARGIMMLMNVVIITATRICIR
ncbi:MAG TPA: PRC-barrel domain-containing protein [Ensifer sp.]|nr:PRC-barrel domain-containing protein [Ensifer sp.]